MSSTSAIARKSGRSAAHPFVAKEPKPTRARLVSLLDPLGRRRYGEVERFLATINGATSGLFHYHNGWGWAVRYMLGVKETLCTLHLLPNVFEATVPLHPSFITSAEGQTLEPELRRKVARSPKSCGQHAFRLPLRAESDYAHFRTLIRAKADNLAKAKRR